MAVIFDEVTADVQAPARGAPLAPRPDSAVSQFDAQQMRRELERQAERQARLQTD
ncbi:MAG TPA: hypothetical protein VI454_15225 [Verrucomicrobiae bacterium]|jgi:hypothetical protein